jgi:hypothetical protein
VKKLALVVAIAAVSCSAHSRGTAHAVRVTDQGGIIRLEGGDMDQAAQAAVKTMKGECGDRFTVTAIDDAAGSSAQGYVVAGAGFDSAEIIPAVWRELSYQCGGAGKASPLTARVLSWAARADQADAERLAKDQAMRRAYAAYPCDAEGQCADGGMCISGTCWH